MSHRTLVVVSRTCLVMLFVAAVALLGLAIVSLTVSEPTETDGWLQGVFGRVFATTATISAAVLGVPAAIGLWAMAGANADGTVPGLQPRTTSLVGWLAAGTIGVTAVVCLATGSAVALVNLGLVGVVALASLGLGGAASFSPHRGRAVLAGAMLVAVALGTVWVLGRAFIGPPA